MRKCPRCNSSRISESVISEKGVHIRVMRCNRCGFLNKKEFGNSIR